MITEDWHIKHAMEFPGVLIRKSYLPPCNSLVNSFIII